MESRQIATGDYGGFLNIWDLERTEVPAYSVKAHDTIVNCIDGIGGLGIGYGAPELVTGSRDGTVRVWDPRVQEPVLSLEPEDKEMARDCWTVAFGNSYNDDERCVCAGYDNGDIKMFDLRTSAVRWETNVSNGVVGLEFDRRDIEMNKMAVATLESKFRIYDLRTQHPEEGFAHMSEKAHKATVWMGRHLPQNRDLFMTCGGNGGLNMYKYSYPSERSKEDKEVRRGGDMRRGGRGCCGGCRGGMCVCWWFDGGCSSVGCGGCSCSSGGSVGWDGGGYGCGYGCCHVVTFISVRLAESRWGDRYFDSVLTVHFSATPSHPDTTTPPLLSSCSICCPQGHLSGVPGSVELLNSKIISTQPIVSFDWSPDKEGLAVLACLDQTIRCYIVTKLHSF